MSEPQRAQKGNLRSIADEIWALAEDFLPSSQDRLKELASMIHGVAGRAKEAPEVPSRRELLSLCAEVYQVCGALNAPVQVLDNLVAAASQKALPHKTLLPFADPVTPGEPREEAAPLTPNIVDKCLRESINQGKSGITYSFLNVPKLTRILNNQLVATERLPQKWHRFCEATLDGGAHCDEWPECSHAVAAYEKATRPGEPSSARELETLAAKWDAEVLKWHDLGFFQKSDAIQDCVDDLRAALAALQGESRI